jgi:hypothetical protein
MAASSALAGSAAAKMVKQAKKVRVMGGNLAGIVVSFL